LHLQSPLFLALATDRLVTNPRMVPQQTKSHAKIPRHKKHNKLFRQR
jgi:hypothetical protein